MGEYRCPQWHLPTVDPVPGGGGPSPTFEPARRWMGDGPLNLHPEGRRGSLESVHGQRCR